MLLAVWMGALLAPPARAVLPPGAYLSMQRRAPERLQIEVTSVQQEKQSEDKDLVTMGVSVQARVLAVRRTATGLKAGARITIFYTIPQPKSPGFIGENITPLLTKGDRCPAYLERRAEKPAVYAPAAGEYTFEKYKDKQ